MGKQLSGMEGSMCPVDKLSASDKEVFDRIIRDITAGRQLKIMTAEDENVLTQQAHWAVDHAPEWQALKTFHHARNAFTKLFESSDTTARLPYLRASYLKMLAHTNPQPKINWNYTVATAWKDALLNNYGNFLAGTRPQDLQRRFSRTFMYIPKSGRSQEREKRGDVGGVRLFVWQSLTWAFKPMEKDCNLQKANDSGIPKKDALMHNRSVASYLLARALGLERIIVKTEFAYYHSDRLEPGIIMEGASGAETQKMLPDLRLLALASGQTRDMGEIRENFKMMIKPHKRRDLSFNSFKNISIATDLIAATWLDYIAAQMDRHLNNIYVNFSRTGVYQGIKLIDNDMAFGTVKEPQKLKAIRNSQNCGIPAAIPPELAVRIRALAAAIPDADRFWDQCQQGDPVLPRNLEIPVSCMAGITKLLTKPEFAALMGRMNIAAERAKSATPVNVGTVNEMVRQYEKAANLPDQPSNAQIQEKQDISDASYWHRMLSVYEPQSVVPVEYDNPPKTAEEWVKGGRRNH